MPCGTFDPATGTFTVTLRWTSGTPDPVNELVQVCIPGVTPCTEIQIPGPIPPGSPMATTLTGLPGGTTFAWAVSDFFSDGSQKDSAQAQFTTPTPPIAKQPATNLQCAST